MGIAFNEAWQAFGSTSPNPAVGAVVVNNGMVVGKGATRPPGQAHAEVVALGEAGDAARGASLYVTLEPCCHWGKTPPCTSAILAAGVSEVVVAALDPNPRVAGEGIAELRSGGVEVSLLQSALTSGDDTRELYEGFAKHIVTGLPFVVAKFAMSLDGKIATHTGDSKWVTGPLARGHVHALRRQVDAILVGANTIDADDPQLTARDVDNQALPRQPVRVALDSRCRMSSESQLLRQPGQTLIYTTAAASPRRMDSLRRAGAEIVVVGATSDRLVDPQQVLVDLGQRGIVTLLVEGGGKTLGSLFDLGMVDKVLAYVAPVVIGGADAASPVEGLGAAEMAVAHRLTNVTVQHFGQDLLVKGYPKESSGDDIGVGGVHRNS